MKSMEKLDPQKLLKQSADFEKSCQEAVALGLDVKKVLALLLRSPEAKWNTAFHWRTEQYYITGKIAFGIDDNHIEVEFENEDGVKKFKVPRSYFTIGESAAGS